MKKLVFLVTLMVTLIVCSAQSNTQDLFESAFTFPAETDTINVKINPESTQTDINAVTVCLRFFTDLTKEYSLFSLASPANDNGFLIWHDKDAGYSVYVMGNRLYLGLKGELNQWNSLCATWESTTGLAQVWLNGKSSTRKSVSPGNAIRGTPSIILGQEQDSHGGSFDAKQSFVGSLTDVYMWDSVLSPKEIQYYLSGIIAKSGNVVDWRQIKFTNTGAVVEGTSVLGFAYHCN